MTQDNDDDNYDNYKPIPVMIYSTAVDKALMHHNDAVREFIACMMATLAQGDQALNEDADTAEKTVRIILIATSNEIDSDPIVMSNIPLDMAGDQRVLREALAAVTDAVNKHDDGKG